MPRNSTDKLIIQLDLKGDKVVAKNLSNVGKGIKNTGKESDAATGLLEKYGGALAALGAATGLASIIKEQAAVAKEALNVSKSLGVSTEALTGWQYASERAGLGSEKMADIFKDTAEKIGDAYRNGAGEAKEALEGLGLSIEDINKLAPDQQLLAIGKALDSVQTQGEKVQIMEALANDATRLIPLLQDDAKELKNLIGQADSFGLTLSQVEAEQLAEVDDKIAELDASFTGLTRQLATQFAPGLSDILKLIAEGIPAAVNAAQPAFEGIGNDVKNIWEWFNPDENSLGDLEAAIQKQRDLATEFQRFINKGQKASAADKLIELQAQAQLVELLKRQQAYQQDFRDNKPKASATDDSSDAGSASPTSSASGIKAVATLEKQLILRQANSEAAKQYYEITQGSLQNITADEKQTLLNLAEEIDLRTALAIQQKTNSAEATARSELDAQQQSTFIEQANVGLEAVINATINERDAVEAHYSDLQFMLEDANALELITAEEHAAYLIEIEQRKQKEINNINKSELTKKEKFQKKSYANQSKQVFGDLANITSGVAQHNRGLFEINKVAGIANAVISTHAGVAKSLESYPMPLAGIMAAAHLAAGTAQVSAIKSASFSGGGSSGGGSFNTPIPPSQIGQPISNSTPSAEPQTQIKIVIQGNVLGNEEFRDDIVTALKDAQQNDEI